MKKEKGFTLVELLIVVAIIGILAAIAIPQFTKYKTKSAVAALKSELKNAYTAGVAYLTDKPGFKVESAQTLQNAGYKLNPDIISFVTANMTQSDGTIVLRHKALDDKNTNNVTGLGAGQGKVDAQGVISVPTPK